MNQKKIGLFLKTLRTEKGLTQKQLAEDMNVSNRTVSRWETGSNMPDLSLLVKLAEYYSVDIREIINGERQSETMDEAAKETLLSLAEYTELEKESILKRIRWESIYGVVALLLFIPLRYFFNMTDALWLAVLSNACLVVALLTPLHIARYTTDILKRIKNRQKQSG